MKFLFYISISSFLFLVFIALTYDKTVTPSLKFIKKYYKVLIDQTFKYLAENKWLRISLCILLAILFLSLKYVEYNNLNPSEKAAIAQSIAWFLIFDGLLFFILFPFIVLLLIIGPIIYYYKKNS